MIPGSRPIFSMMSISPHLASRLIDVVAEYPEAGQIPALGNFDARFEAP